MAFDDPSLSRLRNNVRVLLMFLGVFMCLFSLRRLTGFQVPPPVTSTGNVFSLRLTSDFAVSAHGFKLIYEGRMCACACVCMCVCRNTAGGGGGGEANTRHILPQFEWARPLKMVSNDLTCDGCTSCFRGDVWDAMCWPKKKKKMQGDKIWNTHTFYKPLKHAPPPPKKTKVEAQSQCIGCDS